MLKIQVDFLEEYYNIYYCKLIILIVNKLLKIFFANNSPKTNAMML